MNFIYRWLLIRHKRKVLFEATNDIKFIKTFYCEHLAADEDDVRDLLLQESQKKPSDDQKIKTLTKFLADLKSAKANLEGTEKLIRETQAYIDLLK